MQKEKENSQTSQTNNTSASRQSQGPLFSSSSRSSILFCALYVNCLADTETPTRWRKLTVCCPQASQPQTTWNQKVDDAASSFPHHDHGSVNTVRRLSTTTRLGHRLKALPAVALFACPNSKANFFLLHPTLP